MSFCQVHGYRRCSCGDNAPLTTHQRLASFGIEHRDAAGYRRYLYWNGELIGMADATEAHRLCDLLDQVQKRASALTELAALDQ